MDNLSLSYPLKGEGLLVPTQIPEEPNKKAGQRPAFKVAVEISVKSIA
jgi:hypothetical protein